MDVGSKELKVSLGCLENPVPASKITVSAEGLPLQQKTAVALGRGLKRAARVIGEGFLGASLNLLP